MGKLSGWTIFTLRGVAVRLHISLLFLLLYVIIMAMAQFPFVIQYSEVDPGLLTGSPLTWALVFAFALIVSIFLHEFGHVLVAQARGHKVEHMTLMMLGGVSHIDNFTEKPADEFKIAIIGPLVSLAIGGVLFWIRAISESANVDFFCYWIGQMNIVLGIFNLLPAFPTDGGRVLRALLVVRKGHLRGTEVAVKVSQVFAWTFGVLGLLQFNFLLVLIAFFVYGAAKSELFIVLSQNFLAGMKAREVVVNASSVSPAASLSDVAATMVQSQNLILPVVDESFNGVISADILKRVPKERWDHTPVRSVCLATERKVQLDDSLAEVFQMALANPAGGVVVFDGDHIAGIIRLADLVETITLRELAAEPASQKPWLLRTQQAHP